jgi:hypothetical protein
MKIDRKLRALLELATEQHWEVRIRTNNHLVWVSPAGEKVFSAATPSDYRAVKNLARDLKHHGLQITRKVV